MNEIVKITPWIMQCELIFRKYEDGGMSLMTDTENEIFPLLSEDEQSGVIVNIHSYSESYPENHERLKQFINKNIKITIEVMEE